MKWVLIIEPSDNDYNYLNRVITRLGYRSFRAVTAEEGIHFLGGSIPDAILCGDSFPDKDTLEFGRILKSDPMSAGTPLLMASSNTKKLFRRQALKAGFTEVISNTRSIREFFEKVEMCLSDSRRQMIRVPLSIPVMAEYKDQRVPFTTHNFGEGGLFLPTPDPITPRSVMGLEFTLPGIRNLFHLDGEVVYTLFRSTKTCPPGMGIRFLEVTQALKTLLGVYMENYLTEATIPT